MCPYQFLIDRMANEQNRSPEELMAIKLQTSVGFARKNKAKIEQLYEAKVLDPHKFYSEDRNLEAFITKVQINDGEISMAESRSPEEIMATKLNISLKAARKHKTLIEHLYQRKVLDPHKFYSKFHLIARNRHD
jgi:hypothetical protein